MGRPEKSSGREIVEAAVAGGAGSIPIVGSIVAAGLTFAMTVAHNRRMDAWFDSLAERLDALEDRPSWEELANDDEFVDVVIASSRIASTTASEEKLEALRNAVVSTLTDETVSEDERAIFLRYIDEFTPSHLALLEFLKDPGGYFDAHGIPRPDLYMGARAHLMEAALPALASSAMLTTIEGDLSRRNLINGGFNVTMTGAGMWAPGTKAEGDRFLRFITA